MASSPLNQFGASADASAGVVVIGPVAIPAGGAAFITDFGITGEESDVAVTADIQKDDNVGFASPTTIARMFLPDEGTDLNTFDSPLEVTGGEFFRVVLTSSAPGAASAELMGTAKPSRITDI